MEQNGAPAAGQQPISDEMQFMGDLMILQVLADSEQVNDQEREVLHRWIEKAQLPAAAACAEQGEAECEVHVVPPTPVAELLDKADRLACALRGSRVNYVVEQQAAKVMWEMRELLLASLPPPARNGEMSDEEIEALAGEHLSVTHLANDDYEVEGARRFARAVLSASCAPKQTEGDGK